MTHGRYLPAALTLVATVFFVASAAYAAQTETLSAKTLPGAEKQIACAAPTPTGPLGY